MYNSQKQNLSDVDERKCRRDINIVLSGLIRDLVLGGNTGIVTAAEEYFTGTQLTGIETKCLLRPSMHIRRLEIIL